jgi:NtrC-family two-component system sensor histidine kinase KinB
MIRIRLQARFLLAGCLLVASAVAGSLWTVASLARLSDAVDETVRHSQAVTDLTAAIHSSLEREDDALLLFLSGEVEQARRDLAVERQRGDMALAQLLDQMKNASPQQQELVAALREQVSQYRAAGDALLGASDRNGGLETYHRLVNPRLRRAVADCDRLREWNFRLMEQAGIIARDEAARSTSQVIGITVLTLALSVMAAVWLARSVLGPVRELTASLEEIRRGNFDRRVPIRSSDELGLLAAGFNRMAEALAEYRRSSLGEVLAAKRTLEATLNALPDAVMVFDPDGNLVAANPPARRLLAGSGAGDHLRLSKLPLPAAYRGAIEAALNGTTAPTPRFDFSQTLQVSVGNQTRRFLMTAIPVPQLAHGRCGAVAVFDDVTDFVRLDELRSELIGLASHELNTPLTALRMNLLMLQEGANQLSSRQRELLEIAIAGCEDLGRTVEELLDVSRIEAGQLRLNLAPVDPAAVVALVVRNLRSRFDDAGVRLVIEDHAGPAPPHIWGDPARLVNVLSNVLTNALKYSPTGGVVRVRLAAGQNAGTDSERTLQIAVTDQGPGVPPEFRERIFEKFFRVEHHRNPGSKDLRGTGIGLYLCRQIVRAHGGTISCEPGEDGIGTRFVISLPIT